MKVTTGFFYRTFLGDINKQIEEMFKAQRQLATGKRVLSPSDDPVAISRIAKYKSEISALDEYKRVMDTAKIYNSATEKAIDDLKRMLIKAKQYAVQGSTDTLSPTDRLAIAREIDTLIQRSIDTINTKVSGRYIFAGFKADTAPVNAQNGLYQSDTNLQYLDISFFLDVAVNLPATEFFTYTATGELASLKILTPYNQTVSANSSPPPDEILQLHDADPLGALLMSQSSGGAVTDPVNSFTTNGGTLTIRLGDNQAVNVTISANASLNDIRDAINNQASQYVKAWVVNVGTSTSPDYRLVIGSIPNGKSDMIRIDVTTTDAPNSGLNLLAYNPESGNVSMSFQENINGYNYISDPADPNYYSFNNNYLNENYYLRALHFLKVALENNDQGRIQKAVAYIDKIADKLFKQQSLIGARLNKIETITDYNLEIETNTKVALSNDQDADAIKVISELNRRMSVLQALRTTLTDFFRSNLFDFLR
ncbi:flagellar hook-associated protein FlgL [Thermodesulfovibrio sp. 1176]|uniref:flagellar hook-associated protein FlgL n=1 Tax=Thermodesulfovibrio sp. 1176 TaxID=3043424 RepID=UPI002482F351|nr:flagellar hook-associated protein FlgL [Thermodesulfovibrio sp. 1176]MDI1471786.1 flagellar hook-associated protein FlgL [Thermodesulfovibrio sp. 1176]